MPISESVAKRRACFTLRRRSRVALATAALAAATLALASCRGAIRAFGDTPLAARAHADEFFTAVASRFSDVVRNQKYEGARQRLAQRAMIPSGIFDDTAVWTAEPSGATRTLLIKGDLVDGRYHLDALPAVGRPAHPGDSRHSVTLTRLDPNDYTWDTTVEFGVGQVSADDVGDVFAALYSTADGDGDRDLRAEYRAAFPHTTAILGQLFSVDSIRPTRLADGSTILSLGLGAHPENLRARFPAFSQYLSRYLLTTRYRFTLTDASGAHWFELAALNGQTTLRFRALHGHLLPLTGAARPMPDTLHLKADVSLKIRMFTIGVRDLDMDFYVTHTAHDRAWTTVARREPQWVLPLATEHVIRSSLRKPFEGVGAIFRIDVRDGDGGQTLLTRYSHLAVQESGIMRFIGGLGAHAVSDFSERSEREEAIFLRETFLALDADSRQLLAMGMGQRESAADR